MVRKTETERESKKSLGRRKTKREVRAERHGKRKEGEAK